MSQNDLVIANQSFPATRADINSALQALGSLNSGSTAPATTYANMLWYDTGANILKMRSEADDAWISLGTLDQGSNTFTPFGLVEDSTDPDFTVDPTLLANRATIKTFVDTEIAAIPAATDPTTAQVLSATAGATLGAVGSYAFLGFTTYTVDRTPGTTHAASILRYADSGGQTTGSPTPSGTWRLMGRTGSSLGSSASVFLRIS